MEIDKSTWAKVKLDDVVTKVEEIDKANAKDRFDRFLKVEHLDAESLHIKRWGSQEAEELPPTFFKIFRNGQILFPTRNPHLRRTVLATFDGICGEKTLTLEPNSEVVLPGFLAFLFHSDEFYAHTTSQIVGSTNPHVRWRDVAKFEFLLPPKEQQETLVNLLWTGDRVLQCHVEAIRKVEIAKQVYFKSAVARFAGQEFPLSKILVPKNGKSPVPHARPKYIGLEHIAPGSFSCSGYGESRDVLAQCNLVDKDDLCYSKLRPYLDKAFIADFDCVTTTELLVYRTKHASSKYVLYHLHSKPFIDFVTSQGFGTKMPRVSHKIIGEYSVKILKDEKSLLDEMAEYEEVERALSKKISATKLLVKSIINQVF